MMTEKTQLSIIFLLVFVILSATFASESSNKNSTEIGEPFYYFEVETLSGEKIQLKDYQGKILLINVWDTICPPCIAEFPSFTELYNKYNDDGFEILGFTQALYENEDGVKKFIKMHNINYPNAIVSNQLLSNLPKGSGIPKTYLIDQNGILAKKYIGFQEKKTFENDIKALLQK